MKRGPLLIALGSFILIAALAAWPIVRIARALDAGQDQARVAFSELRRSALNVVSSPDDAAGPAWRAQAASRWRDQGRLLALIVKDASGEVVYARPGASPYYRRGPEGLSFERPEGTTTRFSGPLSSGMVLEALYVTLSQESVFYPIRDAAVVYAAMLAVLIAWLLVVSNARSDGPALEEESATEPPVDTWTPTIPDVMPEEASLYAEPREPEEAQPAPAAPRPAFIEPADLPEGALDGPRGLFDAESGLGWEAYLRERLSAELRRSASFEQDLALLITSFDGARRGEEDFNLFASTVRDFFSFKDMAFLFGDDGAALILPNIDVDHALRMSEELQKKLSKLFKSRSASGDGSVYIGLSSRAGRLVDADRIIGEAMAAMAKAKADGGSRILAFRPDPEKFRAYLAGQ